MAQVITTLHLEWRHRWLGLAFIFVCSLPTMYGWEPSEKATQRIANIACWLMGPKVTIS